MLLLKLKKMEKYIEQISINPEIRFGKPCIKGTRITISDIFLWLASGMTYEEVLEDFPVLTQENIFAAFAFAAYREQMTKTLAA